MLVEAAVGEPGGTHDLRHARLHGPRLADAGRGDLDDPLVAGRLVLLGKRALDPQAQGYPDRQDPPLPSQEIFVSIQPGQKNRLRRRTGGTDILVIHARFNRVKS